MARSRATEAREAARQRPAVTLVTSDLKGSTALGERLDPEALREVLNRYFTVMRTVFESHGGRIEKIIGDAIVAVFGLPEPAEDDALRAVEASAESMRALALLNDELEAGWGVRLVTRTGVASGEVTFGEDLEGQHVLLGRTVEVSGVMEQNAPPLEVLLADSTRSLVAASVEVEAMEPVSPKGSPERLDAFRLVSVREREGHVEHEAAAAQAVAARDTRRTVTLVFALAKAHSTTGEEPGAGVLRDVMSRYFDAMRQALEHHGGTVEKYIGDAVMAVFGLPIRHEDDAIRAVRAASDMQAAIGPLNEAFRTEYALELESHIGVNTGEVIATGDASSAQRLVTGDTVNTAARLEQAAGAGEIVLGELTRRLAGVEAEVESIPPLTLKGKAEPVPAYRLVGLGHRSSTTSATRFVGRAPELERLTSVLRDATTGRQARLVNVVGDAGVGKSRLIREFAERAGASATLLRGRCLPYGNGITFWPLNEAVGGAARIESDDSPPVAIEKIRGLIHQASPALAAEDAAAIVDRVAAAINLSTAQFPVAELLWGARRLLETLARERPIVFIVDDLHSAETTFLDLIDALVETSGGAPIVLLCSARRELGERHPEWSEAHAGDTISLTPLSEDEAGTVVGELLGALEPSVRERIAAAAEGNPLYLEQIVSMLVETKAIERDGERWVARASARQLAIPPTVQALVAARLDALGSEERQVIEPASVIGLSFAEEALGELVEEPLKPALAAELGSLATKELIRPVQGAEVVFRFGHGVIRDTAYGGLLKRVRAALHERFVVWAERVNRERGRETEFEEILGYHLEQAYRYRTDLGVIDGVARSVGERAAEKLSNAGRRALGRTDMPAAASLLERAVALIPHLDGARVELLLDLAEADGELGDFVAAGAAVGTALEIVAKLDDPRLLARCRLSRLIVRIYAPDAISPEPLSDEQALGEAIVALQEAGDDAGLARAWRVKALLSSRAGRYDDVATAAERLIEHAAQARELRLVARGASGYANQAVWSSQPVASLTPRIEGFLEQVAGDRKAEANISLGLAQLHAMQASFDRARELYRRGQALLRDLGPSVSAMTTSIAAARVELLAGSLEVAEAELRRDEADLAEINERYYRSSIAAALARVLVRQGRWDEADRFAKLAEDLADPEDTDPQVLWRAVRARLLAERGDREAALELIDDAVSRSSSTDDVILQADVLQDQAEVLTRLGLHAEAEPLLRAALARYEQKGDVVSAGAIRERIARRMVEG